MVNEYLRQEREQMFNDAKQRYVSEHHQKLREQFRSDQYNKQAVKQAQAQAEKGDVEAQVNHN